MTLTTSSSSAELIANAVVLREQAALDAYSGLTLLASVGREELARALLQVHETAEETSVPRIGKATGKREASLGTLEEFLTLRGHNGRPTDFTTFVELYNGYVDHTLRASPSGKRYVANNLNVATDDDMNASPRSRRPVPSSSGTGGASARASIIESVDDPRVLGMAHSINVKMQQAREQGSPLAERSGMRVPPTGVTPGGGRMSMVTSNAEAPQLSDNDDSFNTFDRRRQRASVTEGGSFEKRPSVSPQPQDSPEFKCATATTALARAAAAHLRAPARARRTRAVHVHVHAHARSHALCCASRVWCACAARRSLPAAGVPVPKSTTTCHPPTAPPRAIRTTSVARSAVPPRTAPRWWAEWARARGHRTRRRALLVSRVGSTAAAAAARTGRRPRACAYWGTRTH